MSEISMYEAQKKKMQGLAGKLKAAMDEVGVRQ